MAHYAQTVNVIGAIKTSKVAAEMETTGLVLQMYRAHYGQIPFVLNSDGGPLDIAAALTSDKKTLTVGVVNPTNEEMEVKLGATGLTPAGTAVRWTVAGTSGEAHNTPGQSRVIDLQRSEATATTLKVPALSASVFTLPLK